MDDLIDAYLDRLGLPRPASPDLAALTSLTRAHLRTIPFENLDIHLGRAIELSDRAIVDKLVRQRRGGFCYELNGGFAVLLRELGFRVTLLQARVVSTSGEVGPPYDHLALRVDLDRPFLVDVGFGAFVDGPIPLDPGRHHDSAGPVEIEQRPDGDLLVTLAGAPRYLLDLRPRALADFQATCWFQQTWPESHFRQGLVCSLLTEDGRITLAGRLLVRTVGAERTEVELPDAQAVLAAYRDAFGIELTEEPTPI